MRPTRAEIHLSLLRSNIENIREAIGSGVRIMGIVKANAYGHGLVEISDAFVRFGVDYLGVGFLEEGIQLRTAGITAPVLVLGGVLGDQIAKFLAFDFEITVSSFELARYINNEVERSNGRKARVHLKIDTGMERLGVRADNAVQFVQSVARLPKLEIVGIFSHFADSEEAGSEFTTYQLNQFTSVIDELTRLKIEIPYKHIANSGGVLHNRNSYFNLVRPGIMTYGIYPSLQSQKNISVTPILSLKSKIVFLKDVPANRSVSYNRTYFTSVLSRIATLPLGYGDGYSRMLSNKSEVLIHGKRFPVVGTVCMDQLMVDVTDGDAHVGDDVTLIGKDGSEEISVNELADKIGTNSYEVLTNISQRVPRAYVGSVVGSR